MAAESPAKTLRRILDSPGVHLGPACFDALSAKLIERAGFQYCFTSGFSISAARLGLPDTGFISYGEMVEQGQQITQAVSIPVIGDGDNGYGNAMNVKRTVKGYIHAGIAGIILEDQVSPKACGHTRGRKVVSREEAVMQIKAAVDARRESGSDIVIVARTDSRQAVSLDESLWRTKAFADAGADVLFIDALASKEEMEAFCKISPHVPKMANMLEGGGKTPILTPHELEVVGYKLVVYPLSLIGVSIKAMQEALNAIKNGCIPSPGSMPSFEEIKEIVGFNSYYEEEKRYAVGTSQLSSQRVLLTPFQDPHYQRTYEIPDSEPLLLFLLLFLSLKPPLSSACRGFGNQAIHIDRDFLPGLNNAGEALSKDNVTLAMEGVKLALRIGDVTDYPKFACMAFVRGWISPWSF
ncbi:hypothetical protein FEM48_Zijuj07G0030900 [Ziziphus jujuba var. spinosa]|uniref:Isocitrate lyase n=1 Tax=Ziziphus jujuba var. spinosa TaxID=714518 RepID=A0A978V233_ZIZJJ|nr:hypothetical protein FEM48_Zijuj07G0030900 [Ziziphus jujuba var. spinosa]